MPQETHQRDGQWGQSPSIHQEDTSLPYFRLYLGIWGSLRVPGGAEPFRASSHERVKV